MLSELVTQTLDLKNAKRVLADSDEAFVALGRTEWADTLQRFIADRCDSILAKIAVAKP